MPGLGKCSLRPHQRFHRVFGIILILNRIASRFQQQGQGTGHLTVATDIHLPSWTASARLLAKAIAIGKKDESLQWVGHWTFPEPGKQLRRVGIHTRGHIADDHRGWPLPYTAV